MLLAPSFLAPSFGSASIISRFFTFATLYAISYATKNNTVRDGVVFYYIIIIMIAVSMNKNAKL